MIIILIILIVAVHHGYGVEINCKYSSDFDWFTVGKVYTCSVQQKLDALHTDSGVIGVNGIHIGKRTNKDVKAIRIYNRNVYYFSSGYDKYFTNIEVIQVYGSKLKIITQKDLKPFIKLKHIDLCKNDLEELEKDLFKFNDKLEVIKASGNKLKFIDVTAFEGLYKLHTLELNENHCIWKSTGSRDNLDEDEEITREEAIDVMYEARTRCYRDYILRELYEMEMGKFLKERSEIVVSLQSKIEDLTMENDMFYDKMRKYKDELDICLSNEINKPAEEMEMMMKMQMEASTMPTNRNGNMMNGQRGNDQNFNGPQGANGNGQKYNGPQGASGNGQKYNGPQGTNGNEQKYNGLQGANGNGQKYNEFQGANINGIQGSSYNDNRPSNGQQSQNYDGRSGNGRNEQYPWDGWNKDGRSANAGGSKYGQDSYGNDLPSRGYSWRY